MAKALPIRLLLDVHDDLQILRAIEAFVGGRRGAIVVRPTPGFNGSGTLCQDVLYAAGLSTKLRRGRPYRSSREQAAARLRGARVRELWVLRAHTITGWNHLGLLATAVSAQLTLVIHAPQPDPYLVAGLRIDGLRAGVPRVIRLTRDTLALSLGITPREGWELGVSGPTMWLPVLPV